MNQEEDKRQSYREVKIELATLQEDKINETVSYYNGDRRAPIETQSGLKIKLVQIIAR